MKTEEIIKQIDKKIKEIISETCDPRYEKLELANAAGKKCALEWVKKLYEEDNE